MSGGKPVCQILGSCGEVPHVLVCATPLVYDKRRQVGPIINRSPTEARLPHQVPDDVSGSLLFVNVAYAEIEQSVHLSQGTHASPLSCNGNLCDVASEHSFALLVVSQFDGNRITEGNAGTVTQKKLQ